MFRHRKDTRTARTADPRTGGAHDRAVLTAEKFVRRAWAHELARRSEREQFALRIERSNCDTAFELLAVAQRDGDPRQISAARTAVLQAQDAVRAATAARNQARRTLRKELRLLRGKPKKLTAAIFGGYMNRRGRAAAALRDTAPGPQHAQHPSTPVDLRSRAPRRRDLLHLMRRRTSGLEQQ